MRTNPIKLFVIASVLAFTSVSSAQAFQFGPGSGASIGGSNNIDIDSKNSTAIGLGTDSRIMIGHVSGGVHIGGNNNIRLRTGNTFSLGFNLWGFKKNACINIGTVGGHCF